MSSENTYLNNFLEFWRTMRRLKIPDVLVWSFPLMDTVIQIYIINCCFIREKQNVYGTIRNKMRSLDYVAQLCGIQQSWSTNPTLSTIIRYVKKRNPGKGSDTLPVTSNIVVQIVRYILTFKVYYGLILSDDDKKLRAQWLSFPAIWKDESRLFWYLYAVSILFISILGLRGAECYENACKQYEGYGIYTSDLDFYWMEDETHIADTQNIHMRTYKSNGYSKSWDNLHHIRIRLRHSKSARVGTDVFLRIGRTQRPLEPVWIFYHVYNLQTRHLRSIYDYPLRRRCLFQAPNRNCNLAAVKRQWTSLIAELGFVDGPRYRFHGLRKGFATTLQRCGVPTSLIAYAGRWKLLAAIYRYLIHSQNDLIGLTFIYLYGPMMNRDILDFDQSECDLMHSLSAAKAAISPTFFADYQRSLTTGDPF